MSTQPQKALEGDHSSIDLYVTEARDDLESIDGKEPRLAYLCVADTHGNRTLLYFSEQEYNEVLGKFAIESLTHLKNRWVKGLYTDKKLVSFEKKED